MKKLLKLKYILIGLTLPLLILLGVEIQDNYRKTGKFRTMQEPISTNEKIDLTGLRRLHMAAGPLLPFAELKKHFAHIKGEKIIIDGTRSKHGYLNGIPTSYLGYHRNPPTWQDRFWRLFYTGTLKAQTQFVVSEALEANKYGFGYKSFHIASKYITPDKDIDDFVNFLDTLPENTWLYFHCNHGKGRTSIMLVMADIMKNAPQVALNDIVKRQYLLGSVDLFDTTAWKRGTYATQALIDRKEFIEKFYAFICQRKTGGIQLWSEWNKQLNRAKKDNGPLG